MAFSGSIILSEWTAKNDWCIKEFTLNHTRTQVETEQALIPSMPGCNQPWCVCQDQEGALYVYDYKTGALVVFLLAKDEGGNTKYEILDSPCKVPMGQWVSMLVYDDILYMTCSEERVVRVFN